MILQSRCSAASLHHTVSWVQIHHQLLPISCPSASHALNPPPEETSRPRLKHTFLQQHNPRKPIIQVPEVHRAKPPLIIQLAIHIKRLIRSNLHLPHPVTRHRARSGPLINTTLTALLERRLKLPRPWRPVAVAIAVVVADQVVALSLAAPARAERLVDGGEEVLGQVGDEADERV